MTIPITKKLPGPPPAPDVVEAGAEDAGDGGQHQQQPEQGHQDQGHRVAVSENRDINFYQ